MIKVIYTLDNFIRSSLGGGMVRYLGYAAPLLERGITMEYLTMESDVDAAFEEQWSIKVRAVPMNPGLPLQKKRELLLYAAFQEAAQSRGMRSIISTDCCGVNMNTTAQIWRARLRGIPSSHNTSMMPGPMPASALGALRTKIMGRLFFSGHARLIPQTRAIERFFSSYFGLPRSKMEVIGNGVDCRRFYPASPEEKRAVRRKLGLPDEALVMLNVGSVVPRKGTHRIIEAWGGVLRQHPDARLVIAGTMGRRPTFGDQAESLDDYTRQIGNLVDALPSPSSVTLTGRQVENVEDYLRAADAFVFASEREGLPNSVLEAMASGLPCLLAPYAGFQDDGEELGNPGTHFVKCGISPASLATEMAALLADAPLRMTMGRAARELMTTTQNLPLIMDHWAAMYHRLAGSK